MSLKVVRSSNDEDVDVDECRWGCDSQDASGHICYVLQDH